MKVLAVLFGGLVIYLAAFEITRAFFGDGDLSRAAGGLLGTVVFLGMAKAMGKKKD